MMEYFQLAPCSVEVLKEFETWIMSYELLACDFWVMSWDGGRKWSNYHLKVVSKRGQKGEILRKTAKNGGKMNFISENLIHKICNFQSRSKI